MQFNATVKKEFIFSTEDKAKEFASGLVGRRCKTKVKKTKNWRTFSAVVEFYSLGDTVGLKYTPEQPYYRDIMKDLASR